MSARDTGKKFDQDAFNHLVGFMGNYQTGRAITRCRR